MTTTRHAHRSTTRPLLLAIVALGALAMGACGASRSGEPIALAIPDDTRILAVDIENFRGDVTVRADGPDDGTVRIASDYRLSAEVDKEAQEAYFELPHLDASIDSQDGRGVVRVRTRSPIAWDAEQWVNLTVTMPRCDGVRIDNRGGMVDVVGAGGATEITNRGGSIEFRSGRIMNAPVTLTTSDGDIWYQVPLASGGRFDLETLDGEVGVKDDSGRAEETYSVRNRYEGTVGSPDNTVLARTSEGNIRVWIIEDPVALVRTFNREWPSARDSRGLQQQRRFRRNLPDDHPEVLEVPVRQHYD